MARHRKKPNLGWAAVALGLSSFSFATTILGIKSLVLNEGHFWPALFITIVVFVATIAFLVMLVTTWRDR